MSDPAPAEDQVTERKVIIDGVDYGWQAYEEITVDGVTYAVFFDCGSLSEGPHTAQAYFRNLWDESDPSALYEFNVVFPSAPTGLSIVQLEDLSGIYFKATRYDYVDSQLVYKGQHTQQDASVDDLNWIITKYYYDSGMLVMTRIRTTSWTLRDQGW